MLTIIVPETELYDENRNEFITIHETKLVLEHSLVSLAKWESKWKKSYLSTDDKTTEQVLDYIRCMTITQNVRDEVYLALSNENIQDITDYINDPMTATTFSDTQKKLSTHDTITAEIIYYWMITFQIPIEFQKWHLSRLMTLINVCAIKNSPEKKMTKQEIRAHNRALNAERRAKYNSKG